MIDDNHRLAACQQSSWSRRILRREKIDQQAGTIVAPRTHDLDDLSGKLSGGIAAQLPDTGNIHVTNLAYLSGAGMSHETILFDVSWSEYGREFCQGLIVQLLFEKRQVPVAEGLWLERDPDVISAPFFVMRKMTGRVPLEGMGTRKETIALWDSLTVLPTRGIGWYEGFVVLKIACLGISTSRMWECHHQIS